ncbi:hypothetical protein HYT17_01965 [Candidatus Microgenomates bacterium]|nr:hypothetical protein [Candidatus Microgenomates bacterium]
MLGELPGHGPNNGELRVLREARQVVNASGDELQHAIEEIPTAYTRLRNILALVGITPAQVPYGSDRDRSPFHFIGLPGNFFISFFADDSENPTLYLRRYQYRDRGEFTGEYIEISKTSASYTTEECDRNGFFLPGTRRMSTTISPDTEISSDSPVALERINFLADQLAQSITKDEHQPESIQREAQALYARLAEILPLRQIRRRKTLKEITVPGLGLVKVMLYNSGKSNEEITMSIIKPVGEIERLYLYICKNGDVSVEAGKDRVSGNESHIYASDHGFDLWNPHFVLMGIRELEAAISS